MAYSNEVLADSPSVYWKLDESAGTTATDSSGHGVTGTYAGSGILYAQTPVIQTGTSISTTSNSTYKLTSAGVDLTAADWTMEAWFFPNTIGGTEIFFDNTVAGGFSLSVLDSSGKIKIAVGGVGNASSSTSALSVGALNHICVTYAKSGNTVSYYINNVAAGTATNAPAPTAGVKTGDGCLQFTDGRLDELAIYPSVLSTGRIASHFSVGTSTTTFLPVWPRVRFNG